MPRAIRKGWICMRPLLVVVEDRLGSTIGVKAGIAYVAMTWDSEQFGFQVSSHHSISWIGHGKHDIVGRVSWVVILKKDTTPHLVKLKDIV